ncbi:MAG: sigma-70 family RNA polymerase sigma factor [Gemmataceae bacterium]|nr:sigma-70 family RNA polymerase sigma factor [Gemmataceae bacterium]
MFDCDCPPGDCAGQAAAFQAGDRAAGDALARKFSPLVRAIVARVLGPSRREDWDDACQAIFLRLFANLGRWEAKCPFCKWLAVVAARRAIDLSKVPVKAGTFPLEQVADNRPPPPDTETLERIERIASGFPAEWRQAWDDYVSGEKREDIARRLGRSLRTVQYWLAEMLDQVREGLGE